MKKIIQNLDQYMMFINYSLTIAIALMRLFKALDRFSKMVFPYSYLKGSLRTASESTHGVKIVIFSENLA